MSRVPLALTGLWPLCIWGAGKRIAIRSPFLLECVSATSWQSILRGRGWVYVLFITRSKV